MTTINVNTKDDTNKRKRVISQQENKGNSRDQGADDEGHNDSAVYTLERFFGQDQADKYSFSKKTVHKMKKTIALYNTVQNVTSSAGVRAGQSRQLREQLEEISGVDVPSTSFSCAQRKKLAQSSERRMAQTRRTVTRVVNSMISQDEETSSQMSEESMLSKAETGVELQREKEPEARISEHSFDLRFASACSHFLSPQNMYVKDQFNRVKEQQKDNPGKFMQKQASALGKQWTSEVKEHQTQMFDSIRQLNDTQLTQTKKRGKNMRKTDELETRTLILKYHQALFLREQTYVRQDAVLTAMDNLTESSLELIQVLTDITQSTNADIKEAALNTLKRISPNYYVIKLTELILRISPNRNDQNDVINELD